MTMRLAFAAVLALTVPAPASSWPSAESFMNAELVCSNHPQPRDCQFGMATFPEDYGRAIEGDYQAQINVAYCFETGCSWAVKENQTLACAWHIVAMGSGHPQVTDADRRFAEAACARLDSIGRKTAERQADGMLKALGVE